MEGQNRNFNIEMAIRSTKFDLCRREEFLIKIRMKTIMKKIFNKDENEDNNEIN